MQTVTSHAKVNEENFQHSFLRFQDRQAGIGLVYCPESLRYIYNVYCLETKLLKEIMSVEYEFLNDALQTLDDEFGQWELVEIEEVKSGCGSCVAKR